MQNSRRDLLLSLALIAGGIVAFFLVLMVTGHGPDDRPLTLVEWIVGGAPIGPGFGYLLKWRRLKDRS